MVRVSASASRLRSFESALIFDVLVSCSKLQFGVFVVGMIYKDDVRRRQRGLDFWECKGGNKGSRCMPSSTTKGCDEALLAHLSQSVLTGISLNTVFLLCCWPVR